MGLLSLRETCVICKGKADWTRSNSSIGPICKSCMDILIKNGINALSVKKYSIEALQEICNVYINDRPSSGGNLPVEHDSAYNQLAQMIIHNPSIALKEGEVCFYQNKATAYNEKNVVVGRKSNSGGVTVRIAKGVSVRTGGGGSTNIRQNVGEYFDGTLYITNYRIVLLTPKFGFDVMIPQITSVSQRSDGLQFYVGSKCYNVLTRDVNGILRVMNLMNQAQDENPDVVQKKESVKPKKSTNAAKELREFKELLDDGIITQEEFDAKKKQLLGL